MILNKIKNKIGYLISIIFTVSIFGSLPPKAIHNFKWVKITRICSICVENICKSLSTHYISTNRDWTENKAEIKRSATEGLIWITILCILLNQAGIFFLPRDSNLK